MLRAMFLALALAASAGPRLAEAQQVLLAQQIADSAASASEVSTTVVVIQPTTEPKRALQYSLLPEYLDRLPGNAAIGYMKAGLLMPKAGTPEVTATSEKVYEWLDCPLDQFPEAEVRTYLDGFGSALRLITVTARREQCEWQLPIREEPFISILLPEVQEMRTYARLVSLEARLHIKQKKFAEAVKSIQTGNALARHVAEGPTLINNLVAIAISSLMAERTLELSQQPGAPSLYWPLVALPSPLIDPRRAIETERNIIYLSFPELRTIDERVLSVDEANEMVKRLIEDLDMLAGLGSSERLLNTAAGLAFYSSAKAALIAQGMDKDRVEAMPVVQVLLIHSLRGFDESRDYLFRAMYLPYPVARPYMVEAEKQLQLDNEIYLPIAKLLLPALGSVQGSMARGERTMMLLRVVEAIRLHAGKTGELPASLDEIKIVPVPIDPYSGKPFIYKRDGDRATLESILPEGAPEQHAVRYELRLAK